MYRMYVYTCIYLHTHTHTYIYGRESAHVVDKFPSGRSLRIYSRLYRLAWLNSDLWPSLTFEIFARFVFPIDFCFANNIQLKLTFLEILLHLFYSRTI
jgi:hypothetical protein